MKKIFLAILIAAALQGCRTTEANYARAYERAIEGRNSNVAADSTIYTEIRRQMTFGTVAYKGDTVAVGRQYVSITDDGGGINEYIKPYCVVAGQFKQVFNAKSMRNRMVDNGYPGAFVVQTREPYYFVIAGSYDELGPAIEMCKRVAADETFMVKAPLPFLLEPAQLMRRNR